MLEFVHTYIGACMGLLWQVDRVTHTHLAQFMLNQFLLCLLLPFTQKPNSLK